MWNKLLITETYINSFVLTKIPYDLEYPKNINSKYVPFYNEVVIDKEYFSPITVIVYYDSTEVIETYLQNKNNKKFKQLHDVIKDYFRKFEALKVDNLNKIQEIRNVKNRLDDMSKDYQNNLDSIFI